MLNDNILNSLNRMIKIFNDPKLDISEIRITLDDNLSLTLDSNTSDLPYRLSITYFGKSTVIYELTDVLNITPNDIYYDELINTYENELASKLDIFTQKVYFRSYIE